MSFSTTNPDVDPLSHNKRLDRLERALGIGGGGGGSAPVDFDQYPDNAFSLTPRGLMLKVSIDDLGAVNVAAMAGVGFKGIYLWNSLFSLGIFNPVVLSRFHLTREYAPITRPITGIQTNINLANRDLLTDLYGTPGAQFANHAWAGFSISLNAVTTANAATTATTWCTFQLNVMRQGVTVNIGQATGGQRFFPCYLFGMNSTSSMYSLTTPSFVAVNAVAGSVFGINQNGSLMTVYQLADLPPLASYLYPKSWLS